MLTAVNQVASDKSLHYVPSVNIYMYQVASVKGQSVHCVTKWQVTKVFTVWLSGKWPKCSLCDQVAMQVTKWPSDQSVYCVTKWLVTKWTLAKWRVMGQVVQEVYWLKYCRYGVKHYPINQSINQSLRLMSNMALEFLAVSNFLC